MFLISIKLERNQVIEKENYIMCQKLQSIENRKNVNNLNLLIYNKSQLIKINEEQTKQIFNLIKSRSEMLKSIEEEKMKVNNENIGIRLEQK